MKQGVDRAWPCYFHPAPFCSFIRSSRRCWGPACPRVQSADRSCVFTPTALHGAAVVVNESTWCWLLVGYWLGFLPDPIVRHLKLYKGPMALHGAAVVSRRSVLLIEHRMLIKYADDLARRFCCFALFPERNRSRPRFWGSACSRVRSADRWGSSWL